LSQTGAVHIKANSMKLKAGHTSTADALATTLCVQRGTASRRRLGSGRAGEVARHMRWPTAAPAVAVSRREMDGMERIVGASIVVG